jgi:hypothetical protein
MTIVIKNVKRTTAASPWKRTVSQLRGKIMPGLRALERKKVAFLTGASSCIGKAARQVAFARRPRALFGKILRSQFGLA